MDRSTKASSSAIILQRMPQQLEATSRGDDWTGVTDAATRRRLQNRHAQRLWSQFSSIHLQFLQLLINLCTGKKKLQQQQQQSQHQQTSSPISSTISISPNDTSTAHANTEVIRITPAQITNYIPGRICHNMLPGAQARLDLYARQAYAEYMLHAPRPAALHIVVQLNVIHALMQNALLLDITPGSLCIHDALSPFNKTGPADPSAHLPHSLQPTALQRRIRHRPWIDLFPLPELRDVILGLSWTDLEADISTDLLDVEEAAGQKPNLVVWGDAADPQAWEATVPFLRKWGWLV
jgi:hypothetical protein